MSVLPNTINILGEIMRRGDATICDSLFVSFLLKVTNFYKEYYLYNRSCTSNMIIIGKGNKQRTNIKYSERHSEVDCGNDKPISCRFSPRDASAGIRQNCFPCNAPQQCIGMGFQTQKSKVRNYLRNFVGAFIIHSICSMYWRSVL